VLQGHFTQINAKTLQMLQNNHMTARTVTSLEAAGRSEETVHLTSAGKLFHARDADTGNARSPSDDQRVDGKSSVGVQAAERRQQRPSTSVVP